MPDCAKTTHTLRFVGPLSPGEALVEIAKVTSLPLTDGRPGASVVLVI